MLGEFKHRVSINTLGGSKDAGGGVTKTVTDTYDQWAKIKNRTGQANYVAGQRVADYDYEITVRLYGSRPITAANTITYDGNNLRINSVQRINESNLAFYVLRCSVHGNV